MNEARSELGEGDLSEALVFSGSQSSACTGVGTPEAAHVARAASTQSGSSAITGVAGAVANAVYKVTGDRLHDLPIKLNKSKTAKPRAV